MKRTPYDLLRVSSLLRCCLFAFVCLMLSQALPVPASAVEVMQWNGPDASLSALVVDVNDTHPNGFDWEGLVHALIRVRPGDTLTPEAVSRTAAALAPLGEASIDVTPQGNAVKMTVLFRPYHRIKSIDVRGAYPLFEKDVRTVMTVAPGDIFRPEDMPGQQALIQQRYQSEGYVTPKATIRWEQEPDDGHYRLHVSVEKGPYYVLDHVRLHGNHSVADDDILSRLKTFRTATFSFKLRRFVPTQFDKDIQNLIAFYREEGFADVRITAERSVEPDRRRVECELQIVEGPRYQVDISGNHAYPDILLHQDLAIFKSGNLGNLGIRRTVQNIRRRYLAAGFAEVKVQWETADVTPDTGPATRMVSILINEGRRHIVEQVDLVGNTVLDDDTIRKQMLTRPPMGFQQGHYSEERLHEDLVAIRAMYGAQGYLDARVAETVTVSEEDARVRIVIQIDEGARTVVRTVAIKGDPPVDIPLLTADLAMQPGGPYVPFKRLEDENRLAAAISEKGYPHVTVDTQTEISDDNRFADIIYTIDSGHYTRVGDIFFVGNFRTRKSFLIRESGLRTDDPFVLKEVLAAQRKLRDLNVFESVQLRSIGLKEEDETVHLLFRTVERRPYYLEIGGGYSTDKGVFGRAKIGDHNFFGTGKAVSLSYEASEVGYRGEANLYEPRLLGSLIGANLGFYTERSEPFNQDFGTQKSGGNLNFSRDWGRYLTFGLANRYERRYQFLRNGATLGEDQSADDFIPRRIFVTTPAVQYDSRDSFIRPQNGWLSALSVDLSKGLDNSLDDFIKYRLDARTYHSLLERITLAARGWIGYLETYGGDQPPQDQLFFLGGASTVRGYEENLLRYDADGKAVGGRLAFLASLETRIDIGRNFELIPFVDTGSVRQALVDGGEDTLRWSMGLGLQYITPVGPMGIFYGFKISPRPGESDGVLHISIGYTF